MTGHWVIFKWSVMIVFVLFCLLFSFALGYFWRDKHLRRRVDNVGFAVMLACTAQTLIQELFENVYATRAAYIALAVAVLSAAVLLTRLLLSSKESGAPRCDSEAEYLRPASL